MIQQLLRTPRLRTAETDKDRRSTWLELFYDLVFAIGVIALGNELRDHTSVSGVLRFLLLSIPVWWSWVGHTLYSTRFDTDDLIHRLLTFAQMLGAAYMGVQISSAFRGETGGFAVGFVITRVVLLLFYTRVVRYVPEARGPTSVYLSGVGIGAALWVISIFFPAPTSYVLWAIGIAVDLLAPIVGRMRVMPLPIHTSHIPERFGLFTLIVLGDCILWVVTNLAKHPGDNLAMFAAACSFILSAAIWWLYFGYMEAATTDTSVGIGQHFIYWHLPLTLSLVALGSGLSRAIADVGRHITERESIVLCVGATVAWFLSFGAIRVVSVHLPKVRRKFSIYAGAAGIALAIGMAALNLHPLVMLVLLTLLYVFVAGYASRKDPAVDATPQSPDESDTDAEELASEVREGGEGSARADVVPGATQANLLDRDAPR
jgi:low temperature requirement protein LtrA